LFDGVLLAADTRVTYSDKRSTFYVDNAQKLFALAPGTAIGYVGSVCAAGHVLQRLATQIDSRRRCDPSSLMHWLPRFFRHAYRQVPSGYLNDGLKIMLASSFEGKPNIVDRVRVGEMLYKAVQNGRPPVGVLAARILLSEGSTQVLSGSSESRLCVMKSPNFDPVFYPPLTFVAIGSGEESAKGVEHWKPSIPLSDFGQSNFEALMFAEAVSSFIEHRGIDSVGGLYLVFKVVGNSIRVMCPSTTTMKRGTSEIDAQVRIVGDGTHLIQENLVTGKRMQLLRPWEICANPETRSLLFDDVDRRHRAGP
jgi:hypothetical protein